VAADGSDGNGVSFSPVISANGRYAAFASSSTNLVQGDNNNFTDVFVRDLQTGAVEMVSVATDGEQGNGQSGAFYTDMGYNSIDISEDGRYIVFLSNAKNLVQDRMAECEDDGEMCNAIYLHDRETGQTELVRGSETYRTYVYPEVSTDGRYISYMVFRLDCIPFQEACSDIMLHDRQSGWASNMTQMSYNWPLAPWVPADYWSISGRPPLEISVIKFSPDGKYIAIVGNENRVRLWDIKKNQLAYSLESGTDAALLSLDFSADGELLAGGTTDGILNIWSLPERRRLFALNSQEGRVHSVQFFPGSQDVLAATDRGVWIWRRGEESYSLASHLLYPMNFVDKVALSPKGNLLAVAGSDQTVWLQLLPSGTLLTRLDSGKTIVTDVAFSPDGTLLAALAQDGRIDLWKVGWQGVGALDTEHLKTINDVGWLDNLAFSADGQYLASSSFNGVIWLWKIPEGKTINLYNFSSYSPGISAVAFSPDGNSLVAAMQTAIQFWRSPRTMFTTQYFKYLDSDEFHQLTGSSTPPADDLPMNAYVGQGDGGHLNLYDADRRLSFNVRAPDRIPSDMYFREASLLEDGGVMLRYELIPPSGKGPKSTLYIYERLISVGISIMPVGSSANVEQVPLGSDDGEYVRGDWVLSSSTELGETQTDVWTWDSNLPVQRLRWKEGGISYDIYYVSDDSATNENGSVSGLQTFIPYDIEQGQSSFNLSRDDLVQIAESLSSIPAAASSPLAVLSYTVQAGDTCSGIAMTYGTSVEAITALNHLTSCEIIYVDQQILVPLSSQRQLMYETDMDCNGTLERLQIVLTSLETPQSGVYGVGLETLDNRGLYRNVWQYTIADGNAAMLTIPALFNLGTCQQYIAFGVLGGDDPGLKVYQWDGEQALQIYNDPIVPASMVNPTGDRFTFKVQIPVLNPDSGTCQLVTAVYDWEERVYVLASQTVEEGIGCYHP
jgi:WD40 repeat protein/LysM repeat protein